MKRVTKFEKQKSDFEREITKKIINLIRLMQEKRGELQ